jgi:medium-chain acyl-[acyl-carrier-protein] hydrolase
MDKVKLFCLPYAGGSAAVIYNKWIALAPAVIEPIPVEIAGRGRRIAERLNTDIQAVVADVYDQLLEQQTDEPFALFGHSMGSLVAYELYYFLQQKQARLPEHIFFSGGAPPHRYEAEGKHLLSDRKFIKMVKKYGGLPDAFLQSKELLALYLPILRADFQVVDTYTPVQREQKLACPISVFYGKEDEAIAPFVEEWGMYAGASWHAHAFDGGHFDLLEQPEQICATISKALEQHEIR